MTVEEIRELIALASETGIAELEVQRGEDRVRIRRAGFAASQEVVIAPQAYAPAPPPVAPAPAPAIEAAKPEKPAVDPNVVLVKSPIVGTFYESAAPDSPPFVRTGERVQPGKALCTIESMKLMHE